MTTTTSFSIDRICDVVLAHAAAVDLSTADGARPQLLTNDHRALLRILIDQEISRTAMELHGIVADIDASDPDLRCITVRLPATIAPAGWLRNFETAVCCGVLAKAWSGHEAATIYATDREAMMAHFRKAALDPGLPGSIARSA